MTIVVTRCMSMDASSDYRSFDDGAQLEFTIGLSRTDLPDEEQSHAKDDAGLAVT